MAKHKTKIIKSENRSPDKSQNWDWTHSIKKYCSIQYGKELLTDPKHTMSIGWMLIAVEFLLNICIIQYVPYTEIDWKAYMQETEGFLNGTFDYSQLKGDTGPLVYPAGFVYLYSILYFLTNYGQNIRLAQYIFVFLYLIQLFLSLKLYAKTKKVPPYAIVIVTMASYRIHSLFVLRLFNDCFAVMTFFIALHLFLNDSFTLGSIFYSLAVSIKMNILLYAPCLLILYLNCCGYKGAIKNITICALIQILLGLPFLYTNFWAYINGSFDLKRVFMHQWTVNYRFLPEEIFISPYFHLFLLLLHISLLAIFSPIIWKYLKSYSKLKLLEVQLKPQLDQEPSKNGPKTSKKQKNAKKTTDNAKVSKQEQKFLDMFESGLKTQNKNQTQNNPNFSVDFSTSSQLLVLPFLVTNLIGIACARSLHYQFYSWYFNGLLYLAWCTNLPKKIIFLILGIIEISFNTYPSTSFSSVSLHICHVILLFFIYKNMRKSTRKTQ